MAGTTTTEVAITASDGCVLSGTLAVPDTGRARSAALLLSGSGPLDRDSNMEGQILGISWAFAGILAKDGVASLRYDKRGVGRSGGNYTGSGFHLERSDAFAAREFLRNVAGVDPSRVGVVGHSVGATIALQMAAADTTVAFAVLLAAAASSGREVMEWQSDRIAATLPGPNWFWVDGFVVASDAIENGCLVPPTTRSGCIVRKRRPDGFASTWPTTRARIWRLSMSGVGDHRRERPSGQSC